MTRTLRHYLTLYGPEYTPAALQADLEEAISNGQPRRALRLYDALAALGEV
jgi:hypothetical protein